MGDIEKTATATKAEKGYMRAFTRQCQTATNIADIGDYRSREEAEGFRKSFISDSVMAVILDVVMGSGKSMGAIEYSLLQDRPMIILVELNTEVDRYLGALEKLAGFTSPKKVADESGERLRDVLQEQVNQKENIITTHALFESWTQDTLDWIKLHNYTLVVDEVYSGVYDNYDIKPQDLQSFMDDGYIECGDDGVLKPTDRPILSKYVDLTNKLATKKCYLFEGGIIVELNPELFKAFNSIVVLTYMFEGSLLSTFFDRNSITYIKKSLDSKGIPTDYTEPDGSSYKHLIKFAGSEKQLAPYRHRGNLSKSWLRRSKSVMVKKSDGAKGKSLFTTLKATAATIARDWTDSGVSKDCIAWTTNSDYALRLSDSRYDNLPTTKKKLKRLDIESKDLNYLSQTMRGTNDYKHKTHLLYMTNMFPNPQIEKFLRVNSDEDAPVINQDAFALTACVQWIWRSAIREGEEVEVFIPSKRVRYLLQEWLGYKPEEYF